MKEPVILCVDDEEMVLRSLQRELHEALDHDYMIETADGGHDALEVFEELQQNGHAIPLLISDQIMPDMKGDELLRRIHARSPATLTIMLTGQADVQAVTQALNTADLYRYIAKPWDTTDLIMTVREALRRYHQDQQLAQQNAMLRNMNTVLEQQVRDRTAELEAQATALERKNQQLEEVNASKDKFFSIIAHDLRNPFTSLLGYTDLLLENFEHYRPAELKDDLSHLHASAKHLYALLENLLTWARVQRGMMAYQPTMLDLAELAQNTAYLFAPGFKDKLVQVFGNKST
jgi:two-component system, sensor histidine kinase and response regulator